MAAGTGYVVGCDTDPGALAGAYARAKSKGLKLLPLYLDAANPSPSQGWNQSERKGFEARASADAILALAFLHHLVIGRNIPLDQVVQWLVRSAPCGVIEFIPKSDPMIRRMLTFRGCLKTKSLILLGIDRIFLRFDAYRQATADQNDEVKPPVNP